MHTPNSRQVKFNNILTTIALMLQNHLKDNKTQITILSVSFSFVVHVML